MKETREQIQEILNLIENEDEPALQEGLSIDQIKTILLGQKQNSGITSVRTAALLDSVRNLRQFAQLDFYLPLPEEHSLRMKLANLVKRVVRKMIRPIMLPIVDQQNRFNNAAVEAFYKIYDQQTTLLMEEDALRQLLLIIRKELSESRDSKDE